jgi:hypothetical protein
VNKTGQQTAVEAELHVGTGRLWIVMVKVLVMVILV